MRKTSQLGLPVALFVLTALPLWAQIPEDPSNDNASKPGLTPILGDATFTPSDSGTTLTNKINALRAAGVSYCRVGLTTGNYDPKGVPGPSAATKAVVDALIAQGITPYLHFDYYQNEYGWGPGPILSYDWKAIGSAFASYFGTKVLHYAAFNEPDMAIRTGGHAAVIPPADYATALGNFAEGIHSVVPSAKVIPGGYGSAATYHDWACQGYPEAIKSLLASGALDGIDLHVYWNTDNYTPITNWDITSQEAEFKQVKTASGIGDVNLYCTEFNQGLGEGKLTEEQAAQRLLTLTWSILACTKNDNTTPCTQLALVYSLTQDQGDLGVFSVLSPWRPKARGVTIKLVSQLTSGMQFVPGSITQGGCELSGTGKRLWVIHNIATWLTAPSPTYTCTDIPPNAMQLMRYSYDGLKETVLITPGSSSYTFTDLPLGETTMILASP